MEGTRASPPRPRGGVGSLGVEERAGYPGEAGPGGKNSPTTVKSVDEDTVSDFKMTTPDVVNVDRIAELAVAEAKAGVDAVKAVVERALQYFDTYHSVGAIRTVEDLRRVTKADGRVIRAVLEALVAHGVLERGKDGLTYNYKARRQ